MKSRLFLSLGIVLVLCVSGFLYLGRGPDYTLEWSRDVPSKLTLAELDPALRDMQSWPIYFHDLHAVHLANGSKTLDAPGVGAEVIFEMSPRGKEWKRYTIEAKVIAYEPGKKLRFALVKESSGKTERMLKNLEWEVSVRAPNESESFWKSRGYTAVIHGESRADTENMRSRFFGRFSERGLMNQTYWVDLVRLANFIENKAAWAGDYAPEYR